MQFIARELFLDFFLSENQKDFRSLRIAKAHLSRLSSLLLPRRSKMIIDNTLMLIAPPASLPARSYYMMWSMIVQRWDKRQKKWFTFKFNYSPFCRCICWTITYWSERFSAYTSVEQPIYYYIRESRCNKVRHFHYDQRRHRFESCTEFDDDDWFMSLHATTFFRRR